MPKITQDRIDNAIEIKRRMLFRHRHAAIHSLVEVDPSRFKDEDLTWSRVKYVPVSIFTAIEVFIRMAVADLINHGPPFTERAADLAKNMSFDLPAILSLVGRTVSIGEVVGHALSLNSLAQINANMSTIIGQDFLHRLATVRDRYDIEVGGKEHKPVIDDLDSVCRSLQRTIEMRHIIVHELPTSGLFDPKEVRDFHRSAEMFVKAADNLVWDLTEPDAPLTQADMNVAAAERRQKVTDELAKAIGDLTVTLGKRRIDQFMNAQRAWESFVELDAQFHAGEAEGGSMAPMLHSMAFTKAAEQRLEDVRRLTSADND